jgi:hypothetical protein
MSQPIRKGQVKLEPRVGVEPTTCRLWPGELNTKDFKRFPDSVLLTKRHF